VTAAVQKFYYLSCSRLWSRSLIDAEFDALIACFEGIAKVSLQQNMSILSLICNVEKTSEILERVRPHISPANFITPGHNSLAVRTSMQGLYVGTAHCLASLCRKVKGQESGGHGAFL